MAKKGKKMDMCGPRKRNNVTRNLMERLASFLQEMTLTMILSNRNTV
jgi:hypothetical protein